MAQAPAGQPDAGRVEKLDRFDLQGTTVDGKFRIDRVVAEGGFGVVYHGLQVALDREIALKVLKVPEWMGDEVRQDFMDRFAFEAKTIARLNHPNIVQVLDFGVSEMPAGGAAPWMALEWIRGVTLEDLLSARRDQGGRTPAEAMDLLRGVFKGVACAHAAGVAHRDLKPANMILDASHDTLRLLDFGIAKVMEKNEEPGTGSTQTRGRMAAFSPRHAAPEQLNRTRTGPWTDVHALGMILTEVLTDQPCLQRKELLALYAEAMAARRPTPAKAGVDVGAWEPVIARAVAIRPADRWADAGAFLDALEASLGGARHPRSVAPAAEPAAPVVAPPAAVRSGGLPAGRWLAVVLGMLLLTGAGVAARFVLLPSGSAPATGAPSLRPGPVDGGAGPLPASPPADAAAASEPGRPASVASSDIGPGAGVASPDAGRARTLRRHGAGRSRQVAFPDFPGEGSRQ